MIDCSKTKNYLSERNRMCKSNECEECALGSYLNGKDKACNAFEDCYPDKAIKIVQKWSNEHSKKTYLTDFLDKHPNAPLTNGIPSSLCPYCFGYMTKKEFYKCSKNCQTCWNTLIEESEE